jgi:hypothetical protein
MMDKKGKQKIIETEFKTFRAVFPIEKPRTGRLIYPVLASVVRRELATCILFVRGKTGINQ